MATTIWPRTASNPVTWLTAVSTPSATFVAPCPICPVAACNWVMPSESFWVPSLPLVRAVDISSVPPVILPTPSTSCLVPPVSKPAWELASPVARRASTSTESSTMVGAPARAVLSDQVSAGSMPDAREYMAPTSTGSATMSAAMARRTTMGPGFIP